jgi:hypothetical protein
VKKLLTTVGVALTLLALTISPAALGAAAEHPNARLRVQGFCASVTGAHWAASGRSGNSYFVHASGSASCALAGMWVPLLTRKHAGLHMQGPSGWLCRSLTKGRARGGLCLRRAPFGLFNWGPKA